ncbi:unannotated protein [freshwater metagenome]|uniref:Unannotated protein n=1 Tax=freshwater metagenome TaxID=449393 RepID=A0A6J6A1K6_9ZZZZ
MMQRGQPAALFVGFEHWEIDDPADRMLVLWDQSKARSEVEPQGADCDRRDGCAVSDEAEQVTVAGLERAIHGCDLLGREELRKIADPTAVSDNNRSNGLGTVYLDDLVEAVELGTRHLALTGVQRSNGSAAAQHRFKDFELRTAQLFADVLDLEAEAKVRAIASVPEHRLVVADPWPWRCSDLESGCLEDGSDRFFAYLNYLILVDESHLDVELRKFGLTVGPEVFVAEAARDLEVALVARHHQQLLEELRRLGQRVPVARVHPARHEEVSCAFGG